MANAMEGLMMDRPLLISGLLEHAERWHGAVEVVTRTVEGPIVRSTWAQIGRRVRQLANALLAAGIGPGDRVATLGWNTQRHLELYFAVSGLGAVLHTLNPRLPPEQLRYLVQHARDRLLFFDATFAPLARALVGVEGLDLGRVALSGEASPDQAVSDYESWIAPFGDQLDWPALDERQASSLCYTSGTAGLPKGVLYSHRSTVLHAYAVAMADTLAISARDVTLPVVPMFHVNAWGVPYAAAMTGTRLVLPGPGLDGPRLLELIEAEQVSSLLGVPTVWQGLLQHLRDVGRRLSSVRKVTIGGSACPPSMIRAFEEEHGARVIHAWGMTETSPVGTVNVLLPHHDALDAEARLAIQARQGRPVFGIDLRLVGEDGSVLPHDGRSAGRLQVRGPWVASGYLDLPPGEQFQDGWFDTGDVGTLDPEGYLQLTDRAKDVIKSGGEWISSIDLENSVMGHPSVAAAAAIGLPHSFWQERPLLLVVPRPGATVDPEALRAYLAERLPRWWLPDVIEAIDALPLGPTGKVLKRALRERFAGRVLG